MEKQHLTLRQRIAYAHWSAKFAFKFPHVGQGILIVVAFIYFGLAFWFFEPEIRSWEHLSGSHALGKAYFYRSGGVVLIVALSCLTVYIVYFVQALFDKDEVSRKYFLKYYYRKH